MPQIKKTATGKYEFWVDLGRDPITGKRRQVHRSGFETKKAAEAEMRRLQNEADKGVVVQKQKSNITFGEFADIWLEHYADTSGCKQSTIQARNGSLKMLKQHIGEVRLCNLNKQGYEKILVALDKSYAKKTLNSMHSVMKMMFDYAFECNLLADNPARGAKLPKRAKTISDIEDDIEKKYLSKRELNKLLKTIKDLGVLQDYTLFRLLAFTGMRIGEALALEVPKIDFNASQIKIRQTYCNPTNCVTKFYLQTPKTETSIRDIDVDLETMAVLKIWIVEQKQNKMLKRDVWNNEYDFVFTSSTYPGFPMLYSTAYKSLKRYLKYAGLNTEHSPHILRHTHASLLAESGATLEQIQERLGHADDEITRRIYLHVTKDAKTNMMGQFANYMSL